MSAKGRGYVRIDVGPVHCTVSLDRPFTASELAAMGGLTEAVDATARAFQGDESGTS